MAARIVYREEKDFDTEKNAQENTIIVTSREAVNASGHVDQLDRQYGLLSICATALTIDSAWVALGGSITVAVANGGAPGIIYEFLASCVYYGFVATSIAELASSIPSAGGVYHWASVAGGKYGRVVGFFTGLINLYGWIFGLAAIVTIPANVAVQMYVVFHPDFVVQPWQIFLAFVLINWFCCLTVIFFNRFMPTLQRFGLFMIVVGELVTIIVRLPNPMHPPQFVFIDWENATGWSGGVAFLTGMLNGAFAIGTPDSVTHMAEELPHPRKDLPRAIAAQILLAPGFVYTVALMFAITDLDAVLASNGSFPLAAVYAQATGNKAGIFSLLCMSDASNWALARDNVTPFSRFFSKSISTTYGSFVILSTTSYAMAILPHLLSGRKNVPQGPFWMAELASS
ncbi:amino acid permease-domain-containing protein [Mycena sp. CBHHK59/15]|nr:amino acid permease-domain-containing protein [Mycena sp. CBHHK59/15]